MAVPRESVRRSRVAARRSFGPFGIGPGLVAGALATVGVVISLSLPWRDGGVYPSDIPFAFLWDRDATGDPSLLVVLIPLAVILGVGSVLAGGSGARLLAALGVLLVVGVFAYQVNRAIGDPDISATVGTGFYVAAIAGVIGFASGMFRTGWRARREVVRSGVVEEQPVVEREGVRS